MQKHFAGGVKEWLLIILGAAALLAALFFPLRFAFAEWTDEETQLMKAFENGDLVRIHIIANSDSAEDQALKLKVRDAVLDAFGQMLAQKSQANSNDVFQFLKLNLPAIQKTAEDCCTANGYTGAVTAEAGLLTLPAKQYGQVLLPEGNYRGLRITLGSGQGQNWWCILYPQLCLALASAEDEPTFQIQWQSERIFRHWLLVDK